MNTNEIKMNLYIIHEVLYDYTDGMAVIAASSLNRCRELFEKEFGFSKSKMKEYDDAIKNQSYKVLEVVNQEEGIVSYVFGGG